jgi:hypothetical protein
VGQEAGGSKGGRWWSGEEPEVGGGVGGIGGRVSGMRRVGRASGARQVSVQVVRAGGAGRWAVAVAVAMADLTMPIAWRQ